MTTRQFQESSALRIFLSYFKPHRKLFFLDMCCALMIAVIDLAFPYVSRWCMYQLLPESAYRTFFAVMAVVFCAYILRSVFTYIICYYGHTFGILVEADIRRDLFRHMQELSFDYYDRNRTGQLMSRLTADLFDITELAHHGPEDIFISGVTIIGAPYLASGVSTLAKLLNPNVKVIGVEPTGAASMKASLEAGHIVTLPTVDTIADGVAVKTPGDQVFPYIQENLDDIITIEDNELVSAFLDMTETHKMIVENSGLLTVAALRQLDLKGKKVVSILSGGNMDVITMSSIVQHGLIQRDRIFSVSVLLPDKPGELVRVASTIAKANGNVIKLEHNQFVSTNRNAAVELRITLEAFGTEHKHQIMKALEDEGLSPREVNAKLY